MEAQCPYCGTLNEKTTAEQNEVFCAQCKKWFRDPNAPQPATPEHAPQPATPELTAEAQVKQRQDSIRGHALTSVIFAVASLIIGIIMIIASSIQDSPWTLNLGIALTGLFLPFLILGQLFHIRANTEK
jgi:hypothetical protein